MEGGGRRVQYIMQKTRLDESQAGIKIVRRHTNNLRCADETSLMVLTGKDLGKIWKMGRWEDES